MAPSDTATPTVVVLATMDTKGKESQFVAKALMRAGARPWLVDLAMREHHGADADVSGAQIAEVAGASWQELGALTRHQAASIVVEGGTRVLSENVRAGRVAGAIGLGGANGTDLVCSILRSLPYLFPKVMVSAVAGTAAVQWCVAESDICMYPSIGDVSLNRVTKVVMEDAACAVAMKAKNWIARRAAPPQKVPLVGVSSFGGTAACVDSVSERLQTLGYEVILFHASGMGGRALERIASNNELVGVLDITTHELTDLVVGGVYSSGENRLLGSGASGIPQVVVPGAIDHSNFWAGQVPERYQDREFFPYNAQNLLMRTNAAEFEALGKVMAERLNCAKGPARVLLPMEGFSEHTKRRASTLQGADAGPWKRPGEYEGFLACLKRHLTRSIRVEEFSLHINDPRFAEVCVDAFMEISNEYSA